MYKKDYFCKLKIKKTLRNMKIAVPTRENFVDDHFGHCAYYTIFEIENNEIINRSTLPAPAGCGCKSGVAAILQAEGVSLMLAGNMGEGAKNVLEYHEIKVIRGCSGLVEDVVKAYINGQISDSGLSCSHHECHN